MKPSRKYLEHTADILFEAKGNNLSELFEQCGLAVEESQIDLDSVEEKEIKEFHTENKDVQALLFDFLDDLLFYKDAEQLIFKKFEISVEEAKIKGEPGYKLAVKAYGEKLSSKHQQKVDVKAITMHMFEVKQIKDGWYAKVLIDI